MTDTSETTILYPTSSVDRLRARVEALEAALRGWHMAGAVLNDRIEVLEEALREIVSEVSYQSSLKVIGAIARAALDKDAGK